MKEQKPLKDCPCCGSKAVYRSEAAMKAKIKYLVTCIRCSLHTKRDTKLQASDEWNRRVTDVP